MSRVTIVPLSAWRVLAWPVLVRLVLARYVLARYVLGPPVVAWLVLAWLAAPLAQAAPAPVAVFPFQLLDTSGEGGSPAQAARLAEATRQLASVLQHTGRYMPVDLASRAGQIAGLQPPDECGECWAKVAKAAGATLMVLPSVHKVSTLISLMTLWFADVDRMKYTARVSGQIRGDTTDAYNRGIDFLVTQELDKTQPGAAPGSP